MNASAVTRTSHSRGFALSIALMALVAACLFFGGDFTVPIAGDKGLGLPSANLWIPHGTLNFICAMAGTAVTIVIMLLLNKVHNVMRSMTSVYIAFFCMMQLATPELMTQFYTGTILAIVVPLCMLLIFGCYRNPGATRTVFLNSLLLSFFTATQYCYAFYIPAMFIGFAQMGIFNRRTLAASFMGLLTPWVIMLGFGIVRPEDLHMPEFVSVLSIADIEDIFLMLIAIGFTAILTFGCYIFMLLRTIAYNARARAINGSFLIVTLVTTIAICVDFHNMISYVPMLNFCAAMEVTHFFSVHRAEKSFIAIFSLFTLYAVLFACQIII